MIQGKRMPRKLRAAQELCANPDTQDTQSKACTLSLHKTVILLSKVDMEGN